MELLFASNNRGKLQEIQKLLPAVLSLSSLKQAGITEELPEPFDTFEQNAWSKAHYVFEKTGKSCFAEDSGLVVPALDGAPGVFSARYAGLPSDDQKNNEKLLKNLKEMDHTSAYYQTVICLILNGTIHYFTGKCEGTLTLNPRGTGGFGYDPLFMPEGYDQTFAELDLTTKNEISHRGKAMKKLIRFLHDLSLPA